MRLSVDVSVTCGRTTPLAGQDRLRRLPPVFTSDFLEVCPPLLIFAGIDRNGNGTMVPRLFRGRLALWCYRMIGVNRYHQKGNKLAGAKPKFYPQTARSRSVRTPPRHGFRCKPA